MAKAIAVTKLGVVGGTVYNVGNYVLEATIADAVVAAGLATVTQADVPDDIDLSTPEALLNAMGDTPSLVVVSASVTTKPSSPNEKDVYIVPAGSAWAALDEAYDNQLALFERGGWKYITPKFGWQVRNKADNGVLWYDGDSWETSGGGGSGTVTSVGLSLPNIFNLSGSPVTTSGTLAATLANQAANQIFAGPSSGGAAAPGFRSLVLADIPDISSVYATKAYADGLVVGLLDDRGNFDASSNTFPAAGGSGSGGAVLKGDLWTISVAGTLGSTAVTPGDIVRALTDTPGQTASNWAVSETNIGYTALNAALNSGQIYIGNGSNVGTARTLSGDVTVNNTGVTEIGNAKVTNAMLAGSIDLAAKVIGVLPVANGGTGLSALGSALQVLRVNAGGTAMEFAAAGGGITIGTTAITSGTNTRVLYNNAGVVGEYAVTGTAGNVVLSASPTLTGRLTGADANFATAVTTGTGSTAGFEITANSLTTGNGHEISSSSVSSGNVVSIAATGTAAASNTKTALRVSASGANATSTQTTYGGRFTNTSTGTSSTNIGLDVSASGGTSNYGLNVSGGQAVFQLGSASVPSITFTGDTNTGFFGYGNDQFAWTLAGTIQGIFSGTQLRMGPFGVFGWTNSGDAATSNYSTGLVTAAAGVVRVAAVSGGIGSLIIGSSSNSIGTSGTATIAVGNGTAPASSPADESQIYAADWNGAGTSAIHIRNEEGHIVKICSQAVAALTNNVSSGGTNDQVDNWTDLATYATDAAAIRNAIFQLSRKLAEVVTAQRTNGLFR